MAHRGPGTLDRIVHGIGIYQSRRSDGGRASGTFGAKLLPLFQAEPGGTRASVSNCQGGRPAHRNGPAVGRDRSRERFHRSKPLHSSLQAPEGALSGRLPSQAQGPPVPEIDRLQNTYKRGSVADWHSGLDTEAHMRMPRDILILIPVFACLAQPSAVHSDPAK